MTAALLPTILVAAVIAALVTQSLPLNNLKLVILVDEESNQTSGLPHVIEEGIQRFGFSPEVVTVLGNDSVHTVSTLCRSVIPGSTAVLDATRNSSLHVIAAPLFFPYVRLQASALTRDDVIDVQPSVATLLEATLTFLNRSSSNLASFVLLLDPALGLSGTVLGQLDLPLVVRHVGPGQGDLGTWLKTLASRSVLYYVIALGPAHNINYVLQQILGLELPDSFYWTLVQTDWGRVNLDLLPAKRVYHVTHDLQNDVMLLRQNFPNITRDAVYFAKAVDLAFTILSNLTAVGLQDTSLCGHLTEEQRALVHHARLQISETTSSYYRRYPAKFRIKYFHKMNDSVEEAEVGEWSEENGFERLRLDDDMLQTYKLRVVTVPTSPFVMRRETEGGAVYTGYSIDVLDRLARRLGFDYVIHEPRDGEYGTRLANGSWTGMIGEVIRGAADMAVGAISVTAERETVVDFTASYYEYAGLQILLRNEQRPPSLTAFTTVFGLPVWLCWASVLVATGLLIFLFETLSPYGSRRAPPQENRVRFPLLDTAWFVMASFTMIGPEHTPRTFSTRVLVAGFWFFCSIMMNTYTANLAAFLTTSRLSVPIESLEQLAKQSAIKYSVVRGTTIMDYFQRMAVIETNFYEMWKNMSYSGVPQPEEAESLAVWDYPLGDRYVQVWSAIQETGLLDSTAQGVQRTLAGDFAFIHEAPTLRYEVLQHCALSIVGQQFSSKPFAFVLPQNSPMTKKISTIILRLQSETVLEQLKGRWWGEAGRSCSVVDESGGLTFHTLGGIFLLVVAGLVLGALALALERLYHAAVSSRKQARELKPAREAPPPEDVVLQELRDARAGVDLL